MSCINHLAMGSATALLSLVIIIIISFCALSCVSTQTYLKKVEIDTKQIALWGEQVGEPSCYKGSDLGCVTACISHRGMHGCMAAQYVHGTHVCYFVSYLNNGIMNITGSSLYFKTDWIMAFRSSAGFGKEIYPIWESDNNDPQNIEMATVNPDVLGNYKLGLVDRWWSLVKKVKVAMYKGGREEMYVVFNAEGANKLTWFHENRVIESSYHDLNPNEDLSFSNGGWNKRRFAAIAETSGCRKMNGWFIVIDGENTGCDWAIIPPFPAFLYNNGSKRTHFSTFDRADVFAIYIQV